VPPSAVAAGLMARNDLAGVPPDEPAANTNGDSATGTDLSVTTWQDADRDTLNAAGVDAFKSRRGTISLWGYRTLYNPATDEKWVPLGSARVLMQIIAEVEAAAEPFELRRMDGKQHLLIEYGNAIADVVEPHVTSGSLTFAFDAAGVAIPGTAYSIAKSWDPDSRELSPTCSSASLAWSRSVRVRVVRRALTEAL
jgi:hypothetical protein